MANGSAPKSVGRPRPPAPIKAWPGTLGTIAIAVGVGVLGVYMLDLHGHECDGCGHRWRHLGAFNLGELSAHTCKKCGTVQWWKDGVPHVFRQVLRTPPTSDYVQRMRRLAMADPMLRLGDGKG